MRFTWLTLGLLVITSIACAPRERPQEVKVEPPGEVKVPASKRPKFAQLSAEVLKIAEPVKVSQMYYFKDGGSLGIELTDANGVKHTFCIDGRSGPTKDKDDGKGGEGTGGMFVGAIHPSGKDARRLTQDEERALFGVMVRWADKHPHRDALYDDNVNLNRNEFGNLWEIRAFFLRLDSRVNG